MLKQIWSSENKTEGQIGYFVVPFRLEWYDKYLKILNRILLCFHFNGRKLNKVFRLYRIKQTETENERHVECAKRN